MTHILLHSLEHGMLDSLKILPFLIITYFLMEYLEKRSNIDTDVLLKNAGKTGPVAGALVGVIPQCGMSAVASNLYAGRVISAGTLIAVFLSTSDEMLPILISNAANMKMILEIIFVKVLLAVLGGFLADFIFSRRKQNDMEHGIHEFCEHEHCHCEDGIVKSAMNHTIRVFLYVFFVTVLLNIGIEIIGEETIGNFILNRPVLGPLIAGVIGLIPNCASSVVITKMFLEGFLSFGTMMSGLLVGAGVGILVLLRVNEDKKESLKLIAMLYAFGVVEGILLNLFRFSL